MENNYENFKRYMEVASYDCSLQCSKCKYKEFFTDGHCLGSYEGFLTFTEDPDVLFEYIKQYAQEAYDRGYKDHCGPVG